MLAGAAGGCEPMAGAGWVRVKEGRLLEPDRFSIEIPA